MIIFCSKLVTVRNHFYSQGYSRANTHPVAVAVPAAVMPVTVMHLVATVTAAILMTPLPEGKSQGYYSTRGRSSGVGGGCYIHTPL